MRQSGKFHFAEWPKKQGGGSRDVSPRLVRRSATAAAAEEQQDDEDDPDPVVVVEYVAQTVVHSEPPVNMK